MILVTGRELPDAPRFSRLSLFTASSSKTVAYSSIPPPARRRLAEPPLPLFARLGEARDQPLSVGDTIVATWEPHEIAVLEAIRDLGLELQIIFNKGAVMVLPTGVNKALGLSAALAELGLSPHNAVGVGDAENDHAFLALCGCAWPSPTPCR